mmetsp:Transcript_9839/g.18498  ORF Transcript_9839/g.18498 Transcript_9839/m.18498 type:complete len:97 (+) Transcript_9839:20-310(+)
MFSRSLLLLLSCVLVSLSVVNRSCGSVTSDAAHVVVHDYIPTTYPAQGQNMTVGILAVNVGARDAEEVTVSIPDWPSELFKPVIGVVEASFGTLSP